MQNPRHACKRKHILPVERFRFLYDNPTKSAPLTSTMTYLTLSGFSNI